MALFSLRGETIFPLPIILRQNPFILGYYRLLLGFSQKEFYSKGPFGLFKGMEEKGRLSKRCEPEIELLCQSLIKSFEYLVNEIDEFSINLVSELQFLTIGPQLRGSMNNKYGQLATEKTFNLIKELVKDYVILRTPNSLELKNDSGRIVRIAFSSDPDIEITEQLTSYERGLISIEIKGGKDISNIHNRIGEAEKSHQKAKKRGYFEFMTILNVEIDYSLLKQESPTTSHFFKLYKILDKTDAEYLKFKEILFSILSIHSE